MDITILLIWIVLIMLTSLVPPICSAIMDLVDFKFNETIFNQPQKTSSVFGIPWQLWFNQAQGWLNKYKNRDPKQGPREYKLFGLFKGQWTQFSDAWHFFKMIGIGFNNICRAFYIGLGIYLGSSAAIYMGTEPFGTTIWITMAIVFLYHAFDWNITFNLFFDKILRKKS